MTNVLSPRAEELLKDVEDAVFLGQEAERKEERIVESEYTEREINYAERMELLAVLHHEKKGQELIDSFRAS